MRGSSGPDRPDRARFADGLALEISAEGSWDSVEGTREVDTGACFSMDLWDGVSSGAAAGIVCAVKPFQGICKIDVVMGALPDS